MPKNQDHTLHHRGNKGMNFMGWMIGGTLALFILAGGTCVVLGGVAAVGASKAVEQIGETAELIEAVQSEILGEFRAEGLLGESQPASSLSPENHRLYREKSKQVVESLLRDFDGDARAAIEHVKANHWLPVMGL